MTETDRLTRYSRWGLAAALILLVGVIGYRFVLLPGAGAGDAETANGNAASVDPIARLEAQARQKGDDAAAWQSLGWAYFEAERFVEAVTAYRRATAISPGSAVLWSSLGEALVMASKTEPMPAEALAAFRKANEIDARDPRARYFLAVARDLGGDHDGAIGDWLALLADTPPGAPWEQDLRRTIEQVGKINKIETAQRLAAVRQPATELPATELPAAARAIPGPSREQMQAAAAMTPSQQRAMAEGMVSQLEDKLKAEPARVDGWLILIRSRMALGQADKARVALASAIAANPGAASQLREQAAMLGVR
jgi:cytochrome c-type biogenesis protein CcmH